MLLVNSGIDKKDIFTKNYLEFCEDRLALIYDNVVTITQEEFDKKWEAEFDLGHSTIYLIAQDWSFIKCSCTLLKDKSTANRFEFDVTLDDYFEGKLLHTYKPRNKRDPI